MAESFYLTELEEHSSSIVITHKRRTKNDKKGKSDQESSLDTFSFLCINPITSEFYLGRCAADEGGAKQVEVTINGIGERAGNTSLEEIVMTLQTRPQLFQVQTNIDSTHIAFWNGSDILFSEAAIRSRTPRHVRTVSLPFPVFC